MASAQWMSSKTSTQRIESLRERLEQRAHRDEALLGTTAGLGETDHLGHLLGDELALRASPAERASELRPRLLGRVAVLEPDRLLDGLEQRPERDALAVGEAAAAGDERLPGELVEELAAPAATSRRRPGRAR